LRTQPPDAEAYRAYVQCLWRGARHAEATQAAQLGLKRFAGDEGMIVEMHRMLSKFYLQLGRAGQGESELLHALRRNPAHADALNDLGYLYARQGRKLDEAVRLIKDAYRLRGSDDPAFLDSLGWAYYKIALRDDSMQMALSAYEHLERAVRKAPNSTNLHHLGDASFILGMWKAADDAWTRCVERATDPVSREEKRLCRRKIRALRRRLGDGEYPKPSQAGGRPLTAPEKLLGIAAIETRTPADRPPAD
jgi:tetratricopeptide (TPR) repeat protein